MMTSIKRQQGGTLIVSMIFLLVMTIVGLAGMEIAGMEEKIAGNARDRNMAFQAAEAALLDGENYLDGLTTIPPFDGSNGLYSPSTTGTPHWESILWTSSSAVRSYTRAGFTELAATPVYIIENLAAAPSSDSLEGGIPEEERYFYRVTSRGVGLSGKSEVMLQSVYKR